VPFRAVNGLTHPVVENFFVSNEGLNSLQSRDTVRLTSFGSFIHSFLGNANCGSGNAKEEP